MKKSKTPKIAICKIGEEKLHWLKKEDDYVLLSDTDLDRKLKLTDRPEKERKKARKAYMDNCKIVAEAKCSGGLKKAPKYIPLTRKADLPIFLRMGLLALLALFDLFPGSSFGVDLIADILCGFRCRSLRKVEPALVFRTDVVTKNRGLEALLCPVFSHLVFRTEWKGQKCKVHQVPVLDYALEHRWFIDFSRLTITFKRKKKKVFHPVPYANSAVLVLHAEKEQRDEALPHLVGCFHVLLNCAKSNAPSVITVTDKDLKTIDTDALSRFTLKIPSVAVLLRHWTESQSEEWAAEMISRAKLAIGTPDSHFTNVSYDPVTLRKAVRREVLLDFIAKTEAHGLLSHEDHDAFVEKVETAGMAPVLRKAEDPEVVLSVVRRFILENPEKIAPPDETITRKSGYFGAWRTINGDDFCVCDAETFFPWYRSQIKVDDTIEKSVFREKKFDLIILKNLVSACSIKPRTQTDPRYVFNLYEKGDKKRIHVVAFFKERLLHPKEVMAGD